MNPLKFVSEHKRLAGSNAVLRLTVVLLFIGLVDQRLHQLQHVQAGADGDPSARRE